MTDPHHFDEPLDFRAMPSSWTTAPIEDIALQVISGKSSGLHTSQPPGLIHLRPMNVSRDGFLDLSDLRFVQESYPNEFPRLTRGDILFNNTNSVELVGKTALISVEDEFSYSNHMTAIRLPEPLSPQFFSFQLHYFWMKGFFRKIVTQHINQASVKKRSLLQQVVLAIPPANEQTRIAQKLSRLFGRTDQAVELLRRALANINTLSSAVIRISVTGTPDYSQQNYDLSSDLFETNGLLSQTSSSLEQVDQLSLFSSRLPSALSQHLSNDYDDHLLPFPLPPGWSWSLVGEIGDVRLGRQRSPKHHSGPNMRPYLRVANVFENRIDLSDVKKMNFSSKEFTRFKLRYGDILLNEGQSLELVGRPAMFRAEVDDVCFQNTLIRFRASEDIDPDFALLVFRHYFRAGHFQRIARWSTNIAHLGLKRFASMPFPVPPFLEQKSIARGANAHLSSLTEQQGVVSSLIDRAVTLRQSIMAEAFAGQLVPQRPDEGDGKDVLSHAKRAQANFPSSKRRRSSAPTQIKGLSQMQKRALRPIPEVIHEAGGTIATHELFRRCGYTAETIDDFYERLKVHLVHGHIRQSVLDASQRGNEPEASYIEFVE